VYSSEFVLQKYCGDYHKTIHVGRIRYLGDTSNFAPSPLGMRGLNKDFLHFNFPSPNPLPLERALNN